MKNYVFNSSILCKTSDGNQIPKYKLVVKGEQYDMYCYNEKKQEYHIVSLYNKYLLCHLDYLLKNNQDRIQRYLNKGKLYKYLKEVDRRARQCVDQQVERLQHTNQEWLTAHEKGDIFTEIGLTNNFIAQAEEIINSTIIYV